MNEIDIINYYGVENQKRKLVEEIYEFLEAITKFENSVGDIKDIIEELGDVYLMLEQFKQFYEITDKEITDVYNYKIHRQFERMNENESR